MLLVPPHRPIAIVVLVVLSAFAGTWACAEEITYRVRFDGIEDDAIVDRLRELSETVSLRNEPPASLIHLRRRINRDVETFERALRSEGYYASSVTGNVQSVDAGRVAVFTVSLGELYQVSLVEFVPVIDSGRHPAALLTVESIGLTIGQPGRARAVVDAQDRIEVRLRNQGYPFARVVEREVIVDHDLHTMEIRYFINPGPPAGFGQLQIRGLNSVKDPVIHDDVPWQTGDRYDAQKFAQLRKRLYDTALFSVVRLQHGEQLDSTGNVPVRLEVVERKHRTVAAGAEYYTDLGFGTRFKWEHRNLQGLGRRLTWETAVGETRQETALTYSWSRFHHPDQTLKLSVGGGRYKPEAFESESISTSAILERDITDRLTAGAGVALRFSRVEQLDEEDSFQLLSFPIYVDWDRSDAPLNPTKGFKVSAAAEPFFDVFGETSQFLKTQSTTSYYLSLDEASRWIVALRAKVGSIIGDTLNGVPADERFYAGGGGSIRGYPFQTVGPLEDDDPIGGRSVLEGSAEIRHRLTESFGLVAFLDGGSAFETEVPDFSEEILFGAGIGFRYFSPIGPIRLDFAVPLDKRDDVDDDFQIYISIGQAF